MFKVSDFEREICGDFQLGFEYEEDEREFTKLEELCLLPYDSVLDYCDLSDDSIVDFIVPKNYVFSFLLS